jgi:type IV secretory pathway VirB6-like protein
MGFVLFSGVNSDYLMIGSFGWLIGVHLLLTDIGHYVITFMNVCVLLQPLPWKCC